MTIGVGGSSVETALSKLVSQRDQAIPIAMAKTVSKPTGERSVLAVDDQTPFFTVDGLQKASTGLKSPVHYLGSNHDMSNHK